MLSAAKCNFHDKRPEILTKSQMNRIIGLKIANCSLSFFFPSSHPCSPWCDLNRQSPEQPALGPAGFLLRLARPLHFASPDLCHHRKWLSSVLCLNASVADLLHSACLWDLCSCSAFWTPTQLNSPFKSAFDMSAGVCFRKALHKKTYTCQVQINVMK